MLKTHNNQIATEPFNSEAAIITKMGGMAIIDEKVAITALKVVFASANGKFSVGDVVYVHNDTVNAHKWARARHKIGDVEFILIPEEVVWVHEDNSGDVNSFLAKVNRQSYHGEF